MSARSECLHSCLILQDSALRTYLLEAGGSIQCKTRCQDGDETPSRQASGDLGVAWNVSERPQLDERT